jgi:hypothetical protein
MMVESLILSALKGNTAAGNNVFALVLPSGTVRPAITYQRISTEPVNSIVGSSGLDRVRMQIDCWAGTFQAAVEIAEAVRTLMAAAGFQGLLDNQSSEFEEETRLYRVSSDFFVWQH